MHHIVWSVVFAAVSIARPALATDHLLEGKRLLVVVAELVSLDVDPDFGSITVPPNASAGDPTVNGGSLRVFDTANPGNQAVFALPASNWQTIGSGYRYHGNGAPSDPCDLTIRTSGITLDCRGGTTPSLPFSGDGGATLTLGAGADRYCTVFGGLLVENDASVFKRLHSPVPAGGCEPTPVPFEEPLAGRMAVVRGQGVARFTSRPGVTLLPDSAGDAPVVDGATIRIFDTGSGAGDISYPLPAARWKSARLGYKYRGPVGDPCPTVLVTPSVVKAVCRRDAVDLTPPFTGDAVFVITAGASARYCVQFGGDTIINDAVLFRRKLADAPASCASPGGAFLEESADLWD